MILSKQAFWIKGHCELDLWPSDPTTATPPSKNTSSLTSYKNNYLNKPGILSTIFHQLLSLLSYSENETFIHSIVISTHRQHVVPLEGWWSPWAHTRGICGKHPGEVRHSVSIHAVMWGNESRPAVTIVHRLYKGLLIGFFYIDINLGILPLCTEPLNDTSCTNKHGTGVRSLRTIDG